MGATEPLDLQLTRASKVWSRSHSFIAACTFATIPKFFRRRLPGKENSTYLRLGNGVEVPYDEAHTDVAQAGGAEVIAGVENSRRVLRRDPLLYSQLAEALAIEGCSAHGIEQDSTVGQL